MKRMKLWQKFVLVLFGGPWLFITFYMICSEIHYYFRYKCLTQIHIISVGEIPVSITLPIRHLSRDYGFDSFYVPVKTTTGYGWAFNLRRKDLRGDLRLDTARWDATGLGIHFAVYEITDVKLRRKLEKIFDQQLTVYRKREIDYQRRMRKPVPSKSER